MRWITYLLLSACLLTACSKQLEEKAYSTTTSENYQYTEKDFYSVIGKAYANLRTLWGEQDYYMLQEASTDEIVMPANASGWDDGGIYKKLHLHNWNADQSHINNTWNKLYAGVINTNRIIYQLQDSIAPVPAEVGAEAAIAEMRVARALYYWLIMDNFGDAPLVTDWAETSLPSKHPRKEIYEFLVTELTESIPLLSEEKGKLYYGRFNKWAAKALLANIYLNAKVYVGEDHWTDCLAQCNDIINSGKYTLEANSKDIFKTENENSPEIIFSIPFDENLGTNFYVHMYSWHAALKAKYEMQTTPYGAGCSKAVPQFIDTYDSNDSRLSGSWLMGPQYASDGVTALMGSYELSGQPLIFTKELPDGLYTGEAEGYRMNKFEVKLNAKRDLDNDFPFFRYAQVLLMKAECLLRTGDGDAAAALVTQVRTRAFISTPSLATVTAERLNGNTKYQWGYVEKYTIVDQGDVSTLQYGGMYDELGWEFAWEGCRRRDMIRFGTYTTRSWLSHKPNGAYRIVFPIPQSVINGNPNISQNPDY